MISQVELFLEITIKRKEKQKWGEKANSSIEPDESVGIRLTLRQLWSPQGGTPSLSCGLKVWLLLLFLDTACLGFQVQRLEIRSFHGILSML